MTESKPAVHEIEERRSPTHVLLMCSCGWRTQVSRQQNAFVRASQVRAKRSLHLAENQDAPR